MAIDTLSDESKELARQLAQEQDCDVYIYNGPINERGFGSLVRDLSYHHDNALLILTTMGGSANSGYRIARFFQSVYSQFSVLVYSYCKSAGTLVTLGAHRLIMGAVAELGPLDVQLNKRDEIWERRSGLLLRSALTSLNEGAENLFDHLMMSIKARSGGLVRYRTASEIAAEITQGLFSPIYAQISPEGIGEDYQELHVASEYGKRLAAVGKLITDESIRKLVHNYPSHDFVIDKDETKTLFRQVDAPTPTMYKLATKLGAVVYLPNSKDVFTAHASKPEPVEETATADDGAAVAQAAGNGEQSSPGENEGGQDGDATATGSDNGAGTETQP